MLDEAPEKTIECITVVLLFRESKTATTPAVSLG